MSSDTGFKPEKATRLPSVDAKVLHFLGVKFDLINLESAISLIIDSPMCCDFAYLVTPNVDHVVRISRDPEYAKIYKNAWLCLNDSRVLNILSYVSGKK